MLNYIRENLAKTLGTLSIVSILTGSVFIWEGYKTMRDCDVNFPRQNEFLERVEEIDNQLNNSHKKEFTLDVIALIEERKQIISDAGGKLKYNKLLNEYRAEKRDWRDEKEKGRRNRDLGFYLSGFGTLPGILAIVCRRYESQI